MKNRSLFTAVAACFLLSGAAGLLYEVVWMRLLGLVFGHTVYAVTTVLAAFMGGLALGSFLLGRWSDRLRRPLAAYALFEAAVGLYCLSTPVLVRWAEGAYFALDHSLALSPLAQGVLRFVLSAAILLPPTTLMGATLPILSRAVVDAPGGAGSQVGTLYAVNTWGAVLGAGASGFLLLPTIGLRSTIWLGVGLNLAAGGLALLVERRWPVRAAESIPAATEAGAAPAPAAAPLSRVGVWVVLAAIAASGAASMAYEIAWTRALSLVVGSSTYAFSAMLVTFLVGLALGALIVARLLRRFRLSLAAFGALEAAIAIAGVATLPLFARLPEVVLRILGAVGPSYGGAVLSHFAASFLVMIVPTLLIGGTLPLVIALLSRDLERIGKDVGTLYGANTLGTIVGSVGAGFFLLPLVGIQLGVMVASTVNLVAAAAVLVLAPESGTRSRLAAAALAGAFVVTAWLVPPWNRKLMTSGAAIYAQKFLGQQVEAAEALRASMEAREQIFYSDGISATIAVERRDGVLALTINGKTDASNGLDMLTQLMVGHLPVLVHPESRRALVIGMGSGVTAGAVAQHPLEAIDVAELEPAIIESASLFGRENRDVLRDPRVRLVADDGRHVLAAATRPYDIIISEPSNPWIAGIGSLFTRDFYQMAKRHLASDGVMIQWLQGYNIFPRDMRMVVRTFQEVFPHVTVWQIATGDYLLLATPEELRLDLGAIRARFASSVGTAEDLARFLVVPETLVQFFVLSEQDARRFGEGAPANTDDLPLLEFAAPRALYAINMEENNRLVRGHRTTEFPAVVGLAPGSLAAPAARFRAARFHLSRANLVAADAELARAGSPASLPDELRLERARILFALGRLPECIVELEALSRARPEDRSASAHLKVARTLEHKGLAQNVTMAAMSRRILRPYEGHENLGNLLLAVGLQTSEPAFFQLAQEEFAAALKLEPDRPQVQSGLASAHFEQGQFREAVELYRRVASATPGSPQVHFNLGLAQERAGQEGDAAREYAEAIRLAPEWSFPRERLARLQVGGRVR